MRDGFIRKKVQKVVSKTGVHSNIPSRYGRQMALFVPFMCASETIILSIVLNLA